MTRRVDDPDLRACPTRNHVNSQYEALRCALYTSWPSTVLVVLAVGREGSASTPWRHPSTDQTDPSIT